MADLNGWKRREMLPFYYGYDVAVCTLGDVLSAIAAGTLSPIDRHQIANAVHEAWIAVNREWAERTPWLVDARFHKPNYELKIDGDERAVPFAELPPAETAKDYVYADYIVKVLKSQRFINLLHS
jgi:hypothetical protein